VTLDAQVKKLGSSDLMKIDIEGAELMALRGASELLKIIGRNFLWKFTVKPVREIWPLLQFHGYVFTDRGREITDGKYVKFVIASHSEGSATSRVLRSLDVILSVTAGALCIAVPLYGTSD